MYNFYDFSRESNFRKLECDGLLAVEFQCLPGDVRGGIWAQYEHIAFVLSGKKTWITPEGEVPVYKGDALYCKKGGHLVHNFYHEDFCALFFFFPDDFIHDIVLEFQQASKALANQPLSKEHVLPVKVEPSLEAYFHSVMSYFNLKQEPSDQLLKLKFKELILQILTSQQNPELAAHFMSMGQQGRMNLRQVMQENYLYRLSLEEYAQLCNRSLSAFKRDFQENFDTSPGKWLIEQRLKYARMRLFTTDESVNDIAFHSGFETTSHFIRCFKRHYGLPPLQYRQQNSLLAS